MAIDCKVLALRFTLVFHAYCFSCIFLQYKGNRSTQTQTDTSQNIPIELACGFEILIINQCCSA